MNNGSASAEGSASLLILYLVTQSQSPHFLTTAAPEALLVRPLEQLPSERGESTPGEEKLASTVPAFSLHIDWFVLIIPASPALLFLAGSRI